MNDTTPSAIAWSLKSPSSSGGKRYAIIWFDRYVLIGYGSVRGTMQYKVQVSATPGDAQAFALAQTSGKEKRGYVMHHLPRQSPLPADAWAKAVPEWVNHRGASSGLDSLFKSIFKSGIPLS